MHVRSELVVILLTHSGARIDVRGSCSRALDAVRSFRHSLGGTASVASEQRANFAPYSQANRPTRGSKGQSWTVKLVCLSSRDAKRVPCSVAEREALAEAGLGEKKVCIPDISCTSEEFKSVLIAAFPKLDGCGGFDLVRCIPNTKNLEPISVAVAQSPKLLKSVVAGGRVFIRPIQRDLSLDTDRELAAIQVCLTLS